MVAGMTCSKHLPDGWVETGPEGPPVLHEVWCVKFRQGPGLFGCETGVFETFDSVLVHFVQQAAEGVVTSGDVVRAAAACGENRQAILESVRNATDTGHCRGSTSHGIFQSLV